MAEKKPKPCCKNCGDETTFPANVDWEREKLGWCTACFNYRKKNMRQDSQGNEYWRERTITDGTPFDARPNENAGENT